MRDQSTLPRQALTKRYCKKAYAATAAHGSVDAIVSCPARAGRRCLRGRRPDHQPRIGAEAADAAWFAQQRPPGGTALVDDLIDAAIEPMGEIPSPLRNLQTPSGGLNSGLCAGNV